MIFILVNSFQLLWKTRWHINFNDEILRIGVSNFTNLTYEQSILYISMFKYKCVNPNSFVKNFKILFVEWNWWGMENMSTLFTKNILDEVLPNLFTIKLYKCCSSRSYAICICKLTRSDHSEWTISAPISYWKWDFYTIKK